MTRATLRVLALGGGAVVLAWASTPNASLRASEAAVAAPMSSAERRELEIAFYAERAARDPIGAADRGRLAALYLDRGRETGSFGDLRRAEAMARESLRLREAHNAGSHVLLAASLMAQHRFAEALRAAKRADALEPGVASHRALIGEIALELGDYVRARAIFDSLRHESLSDIGLLRLARWYEISGRPDLALVRLRAVLDEWERIPDAAPANLAWLYLRLADVAMKEDRLGAADSALAAGLRRAPTDYRLLGASARLAARRERWSDAILLGERAIAMTMEPATLAVVSDGHAALGDSAKAEEYADAMRTLALGDPTGFPHRTWSLWLLDHDRDVSDVLRRAREELKVRRDVYGYDLYAWALHKSGRPAEARAAMRQALRMGTRDVLLARHAAAICHPERSEGSCADDSRQ